MAKAKSNAGRYAYDGLQRALHEKARLGIMTSLLTKPEGLTFGDLKELCDLTDGNLNRHLEVLVESGFITLSKEASTGKPRTICQITKQGQVCFLEYLQELERVVADAATALENAKTNKNTTLWAT